MYRELADMTCNRIVNAISQSFIGSRPVKALFAPYNPSGSGIHVKKSPGYVLHLRNGGKSSGKQYASGPL
jgi:hypothetical protein